MAMSYLVGWYFRRSTVKMYEQALRLAQAGEDEQALILAATLHKRKFSGSFEVEARVRRRQGQLEEAAAILASGLRATPRVWVLHSLLGSTLSDLGRYDQALDAYQSALDCANLPARAVSETRRNQAIVLSRQGEYARALELCGDDEALRSSLLERMR